MLGPPSRSWFHVGGRYARTYYSEAWVEEQGLDLDPHDERLERFYHTGT